MSEAIQVNEPVVAHHFDDIEQQRESVTLGMWVFLATEIMFFGGLFLAYAVYRSLYPEDMAAASAHLDATMGAVNTVVLICSSLTMALAVYGSETGNRGMLVGFLILTMILGLTFLGVKSFEYYHKYEDHLIPGAGFQFHGHADARHAQIFFAIYFAMTGLHAFHMIIGITILFILTILSARGRYGPAYFAPIELTGLYWHFVDIIWIFLFPLLYLFGKAQGT